MSLNNNFSEYILSWKILKTAQKTLPNLKFLMDLHEIITSKRTGLEKFEDDNQPLSFNLAEFWSWNQSDLLENRTRGILAEFIVKKALEIKSIKRVEWDNYDLISNTGKTIEIKSAAYIQTWKQKTYSRIKFGIDSSIGSTDNPRYDGKKRRWADYYVFCILAHKDQESINPLDVSQWIFYVLKTEVLEKYKPKQKSIGLKSLLKLNPFECRYSELKNVIN